jgi:hypothetical protein
VSTAALPSFWSETADGADGALLRYAIRGGKAQWVSTALGLAALGAGLWGGVWLLGDGITLAGIFLVLVVPGGLIAFGLHCLDIAWFARTEYRLSQLGLSARRRCMWGGKRTEIPRSDVVGIEQAYTPPDANSPSGDAGVWATLIAYRNAAGKTRHLALDGFGSQQEARWLGRRIADWAEVATERGFAASFEEADPKELPPLE